jgi:hypothetical protein
VRPCFVPNAESEDGLPGAMDADGDMPGPLSCAKIAGAASLPWQHDFQPAMGDYR